MTRRYDDLPRIFIVPDHGGHRGYVYECRPPEWGGASGGGPPEPREIAPCHLDTDTPCLVRPEPNPNMHREQTTPVRVHRRGRRPFRRDSWDPWDNRHDTWYDHGRDVFLLRWRFTGFVAHHLPDGIRMPLLEVENAQDLPREPENCIRLMPPPLRRGAAAGGGALESDEEVLDSSEEEERERRRRRRARREQERAAAAAAAARPTPAPSLALPKFVTDALVRDAVAMGATCPITMEPIKAAEAAVTTCFHIFERTAIAAWLAQADTHTCPVCKQATTIAATAAT